LPAVAQAPPAEEFAKQPGERDRSPRLTLERRDAALGITSQAARTAGVGSCEAVETQGRRQLRSREPAAGATLLEAGDCWLERSVERAVEAYLAALVADPELRAAVIQRLAEVRDHPELPENLRRRVGELLAGSAEK
jgi:hypothetical protein